MLFTSSNHQSSCPRQDQGSGRPGHQRRAPEAETPSWALRKEGKILQPGENEVRGCAKKLPWQMGSSGAHGEMELRIVLFLRGGRLVDVLKVATAKKMSG